VSVNLERLAAKRSDIFGGDDEIVEVITTSSSAPPIMWDGRKETVSVVRTAAQSSISEKERSEVDAILALANEKQQQEPVAKRARKEVPH
jgi:hypothetical protein